MKLIVLLILVFSLHATAESKAQKITLSVRNATLQDVMKQIQRQQGVSFLFRGGDVAKTRVTADLKNTEFRDAMRILVESRGLEWSMEEGIVTIASSRKGNVSPSGLHREEQIKHIVKGRILNEAGDPIQGATVTVKGSVRGVLTDELGRFSLEIEKDGELEVRYVGFETQTVPIQGRSSIDVKLKSVEDALDEVVVVGFGTQKKISVVGAVQTVDPSELRPASSSLTASFAGRIAGVVAVQSNGEPGADGASFWIRGVSTFTGSTSPLIIVDGVEVSSDILNALPPESIDQFSILKDATATALFGTRGANGVLVVTTKTGKDSERMLINLRAESGMSMHTQRPRMAEGVTYMNMFNDAYKMRTTVAGYVPKFTDQEIENVAAGLHPYIYPNVDWYGELFKDQSYNQNVNANVTGGGRKVNYFLNAALFNENGLLRNNHTNNYNTNIQNIRTTLQSNVMANVTSTTTMGIRLNSIFRDYNGPYASTANLYNLTMVTPPTAFPVLFPSTGGEDHVMFGTTDGPYLTGHYPNPYAELVRGFRSSFSTTVLGVFDVNQKLDFLTKGLSMKALVSFNNDSNTDHNRYFQPHYYKLGSWTQNPEGEYLYEVQPIGAAGETALSVNTSSYGERRFNFQSSIEYHNSFEGGHDIGAMLLYHQKQFNYNIPASNLRAVLPQREQGLAGRLTYNYNSRYLAEFNFGYNGSENFIAGNRFGFFPSFALGYVISHESYFDPLRDVINLLKIRGSYGLVGNDKTNARFPYLTNVNLNSLPYNFGFDFNNTRYGANITLLGNELASWEIGKKLNGGIEIGLFNNLTIIADIFRENRSGIFMQHRVMPATVGLGNILPYGNLGRVRNQGLDISVDYKKNLNQDFSISARATFTYATNTVLDKDEPAQQQPYLSEIGYPINTIRGLQAIGLFESGQELTNWPTQTFHADYRVGDIKYRDLNDDGKIDLNDYMALGHPLIPEIVYGFGPSMRYKKLDFSFFFQGVARVSLMMSDIHPFGAYNRTPLQFVADDYWSEDNPSAAYPRLDYQENINNMQPSSFWLRDASFLRLKNMEIGYSVRSFRLYLSGHNLLTFSKFKEWDPEMGGGNGLRYPPQRTARFGFQYNL